MSQPAAKSPSRKDLLLDTACTVIARNGVRGLRVEEIAREAGVSVGLIYHHFGSRSGLLRETLARANSRAASGRTLDLAGGSGYEVVRAALLDEIAEDPATRENSSVWGELMATAAFEPELQPSVRDAVAEWTANVAAAIEAGRGDGSIRPDVDVQAVATELTALAEGLSDRWLGGALKATQARRVLDRAIRRELAPDGHAAARSGSSAPAVRRTRRKASAAT